MSDLLTTQSTLTCPHGGTVSVVSSNTKVTARNAPLALATDTFTVGNCSFQLSTPGGPVPHPCATVQWIVTNKRCTVGGKPTLSLASAGICLAADGLPQGPVSISATQQKASGE